MFPLLLDLTRLGVAVVGNGEATVRRLAQLDAAGASDVRVFADRPSAALADAAGDRLRRRLPAQPDLAGRSIVFIVDLDEDDAKACLALAAAAGSLAHIEDRPDLSAVHMPAMVRRGDLLITVSTGGTSPGLARRLRQHIETLFGNEWAGRVALVGALRKTWRRAGVPGPEVARRVEALVEARAWLPGTATLAEQRERRAS